MPTDRRRKSPASFRRRISGCERLLEILFHVDDGTVEQDRRRHAIDPDGVRRINSNQIPEDSGSVTAVFLGLKPVPIGSKVFRDDVVRIPILLHAPVWNEIERKRRWRRPVSREDRLPHHEHPRGDVRISFQDRCDCGRPPQTGRSCRGQQNNQSKGLLRRIEVGTECFDRTRIEVNQWRLAGRRVVRAELPLAEYRDGDDDDEYDDG
jgi:hypothetical protein